MRSFTSGHRLRRALLLWGLAGLLATRLPAQEPMLPDAVPQKPAELTTRGGMATGGPHGVVLDSHHRPITAGGFVSSGPIVFQDVAKPAGLASWTHPMGLPEKLSILDTVGAGVALLDYDNDGWLDIYLVNGSTHEVMSGNGVAPHAGLFHNNHDGTFTNVTAKAGVANDRWGFGAVVGDYDNDGWPDIYVSNFGRNRLYHNNHDGTFTDQAEKAGVALGDWSTGATWGDYDGDGYLDLFVPGYVHTEIKETAPLSACLFRKVQVLCGPRGLRGEPDHLFHNNKDGTFTDVSERAGVADAHGYYGLASLFIDVNGDGRPDLLVADDSTPNYLYINKGDGTFEDASFASGYAVNEDGRETASMGIAAGDLLHKGVIDLYNTTFSDDYNTLYRNDGKGNFTETANQEGIAEPTYPFLGWGTGFFDYDNDGWLDVMVVNGHVYREVDAQNWGTTWKQRPLLFHSDKGKLALVDAVEGTGLALVASSRGMAFGDLFNDGHVDVVINNLDQAPSLLRNVVRDGNHWVGFKLVGSGKTARDAVGASVWLTADGFTQRTDVVAGGSFASSSDQRVHFGLGASTKIDKVEVHWPGGLVEKIAVSNGVDRFYVVTEGGGVELLR